jgi:hypothetical protein
VANFDSNAQMIEKSLAVCQFQITINLVYQILIHAQQFRRFSVMHCGVDPNQQIKNFHFIRRQS